MNGADSSEPPGPVIAVTLPSWTGKTTIVELREPTLSDFTPPAGDAAEENDAAQNEAGTALSSAAATGSDPESTSTSDSNRESTGGSAAGPTTAHLLIPQNAPPLPSFVDFPPLSAAAEIWLQGLAWVVEGEEFENAGDLANAIGRFQSARSAYEQVEQRFPDWQPDIIAFRLGDLERKIRVLVGKTSTASAPTSSDSEHGGAGAN